MCRGSSEPFAHRHGLEGHRRSLVDQGEEAEDRRGEDQFAGPGEVPVEAAHLGHLVVEIPRDQLHRALAVGVDGVGRLVPGTLEELEVLVDQRFVDRLGEDHIAMVDVVGQPLGLGLGDLTPRQEVAQDVVGVLAIGPQAAVAAAEHRCLGCAVDGDGEFHATSVVRLMKSQQQLLTSILPHPRSDTPPVGAPSSPGRRGNPVGVVRIDGVRDRSCSRPMVFGSPRGSVPPGRCRRLAGATRWCHRGRLCLRGA